MMKILFIHRWIGVHSGGAETHIRQIMEALLKAGAEVFLITREGRVDLEGEFPAVRVYRVSRNFLESDHSYENPFWLYFHTLVYLTKLWWRMVAVTLVSGRFDVVSTHFATEGVAAFFYRLVFKTPFVSVLEGFTPLEGRVARLSDAALTISQSDAQRYRESCRLKSRTVHICVDRQRFRPGLNASAIRGKFLDDRHRLICLTVCRLEPRKDLETLIAAAPLVCQKVPVRFLIIGEGIQADNLRILVESRGLNEAINFLGFVPDAALPLYYNSADVFCLPTLYEGFGIVFLEALACGLPVVGTRVGAVPEVVGEAGRLVEPRQPDLLAQTLLDVLSDVTLREELSRRALARSVLFDAQKAAEDYVEFYRGFSRS